MSTAEQLKITTALLDSGIKTGDAVRVGRETWLVAYAENGYVFAYGWPTSCAPAKTCTLKRMGTAEQALGLLRDLAVLNDTRGEYARRKLAELGVA